METRTIDQAAREARNEYMRQWRKKNPEKVRAITKRYWATRAGKKAAITKDDRA